MPVRHPSFLNVVTDNHEQLVNPEIDLYETVSSIQLDPFHPFVFASK